MRKASKSEDHSWRPSPKLRAALEAAAKAEQVSVGDLLDRIVREWLAARIDTSNNRGRGHAVLREGAGLHEDAGAYATGAANPRSRASRRSSSAGRSGKGSAKEHDDADQATRRAALMACAGIFKGDGTSATSERVREVVGEYVEAKYGRRRHAR